MINNLNEADKRHIYNSVIHFLKKTFISMTSMAPKYFKPCTIFQNTETTVRRISYLKSTNTGTELSITMLTSFLTLSHRADKQVFIITLYITTSMNTHSF